MSKKTFTVSIFTALLVAVMVLAAIPTGSVSAEGAGQARRPECPG